MLRCGLRVPVGYQNVLSSFVMMINGVDNFLIFFGRDPEWIFELTLNGPSKGPENYLCICRCIRIIIVI
jgi:hypothetical protein